MMKLREGLKKAAALLVSASLLSCPAFAEGETPSKSDEILILAAAGDANSDLSKSAHTSVMTNQNTYSYLMSGTDTKKVSGKTAYQFTSKWSANVQASKTTESDTMLHRIMTSYDKDGKPNGVPLTFGERISDFGNSVLHFETAPGAKFNLVSTDENGEPIVKIGLAYTDWTKGWNSTGKTNVLYLKLADYAEKKLSQTDMYEWLDFEIPVKDFIEKGTAVGINGGDGTAPDVSELNTVVWAIDKSDVSVSAGDRGADGVIWYWNDMYLSRSAEAVKSVFASAASDTASVNWEGVSGEDISYNIFRNGQFIANTDETEFTDTGLEPGTEYTYGVQTKSGKATAEAATVTVTTRNYFEDAPLLAASFAEVKINGESKLKDVKIGEETTVSGKVISDTLSGEVTAAAVFIKDSAMRDIDFQTVEIGKEFSLSLKTETGGEVRFFALDSLDGMKLVTQVGTLGDNGFNELKIPEADMREENFDVEFNSSDSSFSVSVPTDGAAVVLAAAAGKEKSDYEKADIAYLNVCDASAPIKAAFYKKADGTYSFYAAAAGKNALSKRIDDEYACPETIAKIYEDLNKENVSADEVAACIEAPILKLDLTDYKRVPKTELLEEFIKIKPVINGVSEIADTLDKAVGTVMLCTKTEITAADIEKYGVLVGLDSEMMSEFLSDNTSSVVKNKTCALMSGRKADAVTNEAAAEKFKECYVCALASNSENTWKKLKDICQKYSLVDFGLITQKRLDEADVFKAMLKTNFEYYEDISSKYRSVIASLPKKTNTQGGGGGGGSSSRNNYSGGGGTWITADFDKTDSSQKPTEETSIFTDMPINHWAYKSVEMLTEKNIISRGEIFRPNDNITREEFVKMLVMYFQPVTDQKCSFDDVSESDWFYPYVSAAFSAGIVQGVTENSFGTGESISRQDMAVMLYRAMKVKSETDSEMPVFADYDAISDYAAEAVEYFARAGIINGDENGNVNPKKSASRAECAKMFGNFIESEENRA